LSKGDPLETHYPNDCGYPHGMLLEYSALFEEVLNLEIAHYDREKEFARFQLPSGEFLEVFGSKHLWHPFTTSPAWEVMIADVRRGKEKTLDRDI
jgi:hypothetical protein